MDSPAIGYRVLHKATGQYGHVITYYDNGDLLVYVGRPENGSLVMSEHGRWPVEEVTSLGRQR